MGLTIGVDIGGTKIAAGVVDDRAAENPAEPVRGIRRVPVQRTARPSAVGHDGVTRGVVGLHEHRGSGGA